MYAEIRERRTAPDLAERTDVLSRLIREGQDSDDPRTGSATSSCATSSSRCCWPATRRRRRRWPGRSTSWAAHPELMRRTQAAADAGDADGDAWLDAVMKESMRLHPVIPIVVRTLHEAADHRRHRHPARRHRRPVDRDRARRDDNYDDAEVVRPERFLGQNPPTNTWIPFGGGVRRCIGAGFALMEGVAVLREVFLAWSTCTTDARRRAAGPQHHLGARTWARASTSPAAERPRGRTSPSSCAERLEPDPGAAVRHADDSAAGSSGLRPPCSRWDAAAARPVHAATGGHAGAPVGGVGRTTDVLRGLARRPERQRPRPAMMAAYLRREHCASTDAARSCMRAVRRTSRQQQRRAARRRCPRDAAPCRGAWSSRRVSLRPSLRPMTAATDGRLIHADLHYENVLAAEREPWLVIDPQPMSGDPHYELAPLLWNRWDELPATCAAASDALPRRGRRRRASTRTAPVDWVVVRMLLERAVGARGRRPDPDWVTSASPSRSRFRTNGLAEPGDR